MSDLVAWLRADEPGDPIHSIWRPTRQRFGVLRWTSGAARLDVKVEEESSFVPRFIENRLPPDGSRRQRAFPDDKNELTLAAAWQFVEQQKDVLIYCALRASVETLGRLALKCIDHGVLLPLRPMNQRVKDAMAAGAEWLGAEHPAVACLEFGVALHHGGLPRPFLNEVERLLRAGDCRVTIASPTLAQGLNLSASVLLVPSIWRNQKIIPAAEFANVAGRAGRAFVDVEGLVLHIVWEKNANKTSYALRNWESLVEDAKAPKVASGILQLSINIFKRIAAKAGLEVAEVIEYVTGHDKAWDFDGDPKNELDVDEAAWNRDIASLDAAILALLEAETSEDAVGTELQRVLEGSLFSRELARRQARTQGLVRALVPVC
jgi:replicative superfamily II helicase